MQKLIITVLLGAARAPPPSTASGAACAADGSSASYVETITTKSGVSVRTIASTGCPNHESYCTGKPNCGGEGGQVDSTEAAEQSLSVEVSANPKLKNSYTAGELDCTMGTTDYALNGVGFYSGAVAYVAGGPCPQLDVEDATAEWISFDCCSGHSTGGGGYHYHFPPSCLIAQANADAPTGTTVANGHSPQIGWAQDGFPIYGPLSAGGVQVQNCGTAGADATYCQDECGGFEGELDGVDNYKYRYYITGKVGDLDSLPSYPKPDVEALYFPYTIRCYRGAKLDEYNSVAGTDGFTSAHVAEAHAGYGSAKLPVRCLDGKGKADYDWISLEVTTGSDGAAAFAPHAAAAVAFFAWL